MYFCNVCLLSIEPATSVPLRVASQRRERSSSPDGDRNNSETAGPPPVGHRARAARTTTCGRQRSWEHAPFLGFLVAPVLRQLLHSSSAADRPKPHPPDLFAPRSATMLHFTSLALCNYLHSSASSQHQPHDRPSTCISVCASEP